jgi:hypothetical protein
MNSYVLGVSELLKKVLIPVQTRVSNLQPVFDLFNVLLCGYCLNQEPNAYCLYVTMS